MKKTIITSFILGALITAFGFYAWYVQKLNSQVEANTAELKIASENIATIVQYLSQNKQKQTE